MVRNPESEPDHVHDPDAEIKKFTDLGWSYADAREIVKRAAALALGPLFLGLVVLFSKSQL